MVREGLSNSPAKGAPDRGLPTRLLNVATFENVRLLTEEWLLTPAGK